MSNQQQTKDGNNIIVGPDYGQMIKMQSNTAIIEACVAMLFSNKIRCNVKSLAEMFGKIGVLIVLKMLLEDFNSVFNKFSFSSMKSIRYIYQKYFYKEEKYVINNVRNKWIYNEMPVSLDSMSPYFDKKKINIKIPGTYYYRELGQLVKVYVSDDQIIFCVPNIQKVKRHFESILRENREVIFGNKTSMYHLTASNHGAIKIVTDKLSFAFPTKNYIELEKIIKTNHMVESALCFRSSPLAVRFNGEPGTGKTTFASYIASKDVFDVIIVCNFVQLSGKNFHNIITEVDRQITNVLKDVSVKEQQHMLLILDEVDKWLCSYQNAFIDKLREESRKKSQTKTNNEVSEDSFQKLTPEEEEQKKTQLKFEFLDQLYKLIDGHMLPDHRKYVIIFNTNHFDSFFEGAPERYNALRERFQKYDFGLISKDGITEYLKHVVSSLQDKINSEDNIADVSKSCVDNVRDMLESYDPSIFDQLTEEDTISYRSLHKILRLNYFNVTETVKYIVNNRQSNVAKVTEEADEVVTEEADEVVTEEADEVAVGVAVEEAMD